MSKTVIVEVEYENVPPLHKFLQIKVVSKHGSLKDSDAIIKDIKEFYCEKCKTKDEDKCWVCIVNNCVRIIDDAPTILEANYKED